MSTWRCCSWTTGLSAHFVSIIKKPYATLLQAPFCEYNFDMRKGPIGVKWFTGAQTNVSYNALDRHVKAGRGDKVAFYWEGNDIGMSNTLTYMELLAKVGPSSCTLSAGAFKALHLYFH